MRRTPSQSLAIPTRATAPAPQHVKLVGTRKDVLAALKDGVRRGAITHAGELELITRGPEAGKYALPIVRVTGRPAARWRKPLKVAAAVATPLGVVFGLGWWSVATLGAVPLAVLLVAVLVMFIGWVRGRLGGRTSSGGVQVTVTTTVTVR